MVHVWPAPSAVPVHPSVAIEKLLLLQAGTSTPVISSVPSPALLIVADLASLVLPFGTKLNMTAPLEWNSGRPDPCPLADDTRTASPPPAARDRSPARTTCLMPLSSSRRTPAPPCLMQSCIHAPLLRSRA